MVPFHNYVLYVYYVWNGVSNGISYKLKVHWSTGIAPKVLNISGGRR
jgi:hypothetical protein